MPTKNPCATLWLAAIFVFFSSFHLHAKKTKTTTEENSLNQIEQLLMSGLTSDGQIDTSVESPSCAQLSDDFCRTLHSDEFKGNAEYFTDFIALGSTDAKMLSLAQKADLMALIEAQNRLPREVRVALGVESRRSSRYRRSQSHRSSKNLLHRLERLIKREVRQKNLHKDNLARIRWNRDLSDLSTEISRAVSDVARGRTYQNFPELRYKVDEELTPEEHHQIFVDLFEIEDQILEAKYLNHPNWEKVKRVFERALSDTQAILDNLNLPASVIQKLKQKVATIELSLPYQDPRKLGSSSSCGSSSINAFYTPHYHKFTVCAGFFNSISEGGLYQTVVHEIAHSIDPANYLNDHFKTTKLAQAMDKVFHANGTLNCEEWADIKNEAFSPVEEIFAYSEKGLPKTINDFVSCKMQRDQKKKGGGILKDDVLHDINPEAIAGPALQFASSQRDNMASAKIFSHLLTPKKNYQTDDNDFYLNPKRWFMANNAYFTELYGPGTFDFETIFVQEVRCQLVNGKPVDIENAEEEPFMYAQAQAMQMTEALYARYLHQYFSTMGYENTTLKGYKLASKSGEEWADWIAQKAVTKFLRENPLTALEKRRVIFANVGFFCETSGRDTDYPKIVEVEKLLSTAVHPLNRHRRLRNFQPEIAEQIGCQVDPEIDRLLNKCDAEIWRSKPQTSLN